MDEYMNIIPFTGNKLLKLEVEKDIDWYHAHVALLGAINTFL